MHPKQILGQYQIEPKKSLGQSFLYDPGILSRIADAATLTKTDDVLEIGPGLGHLTRILAEAASSVIAVELDGRLIPILKSVLAPYDNVTLIHGDILEQDLDTWFEFSYKVVANLPYYITGAILRHLLAAGNRPSLMVLTVQKEVAQRITARPPHMSLLSVSVQHYGRARILETLGAGAFWPRPGVDSAVIRVEPVSRKRMASDWFFAVARAGFGQKRKQLKNNLRSLNYKHEDIDVALGIAGIDGRRRAQTLAIEEWETLARALAELRK